MLSKPSPWKTQDAPKLLAFILDATAHSTGRDLPTEKVLVDNHVRKIVRDADNTLHIPALPPISDFHAFRRHVVQTHRDMPLSLPGGFHFRDPNIFYVSACPGGVSRYNVRCRTRYISFNTIIQRFALHTSGGFWRRGPPEVKACRGATPSVSTMGELAVYTQ